MSRIVAQLSPGAGVVTTRADVHYVVTEHGTGLPPRQECGQEPGPGADLVSPIPDFRAGAPARVRSTTSTSLPTSPTSKEKSWSVPEELQHHHAALADGTQLGFRPIHPTDETAHAPASSIELSQQTMYYRFMSRPEARCSRKQIQDFVYIDHRNDVAVVGTVPEAEGEKIVAIGRFYLDKTTNLAEVAFVVHDEWQGRGIGTFLFHHLERIARRNGIRGFTAEVLAQNRAMQAVFNRSGLQTSSHLEGGVYSYTMGL